MDILASMRVFAAVVDAGSFTGAADRLELSRTMVSKHVMRLEDELGVRLLNRTTRRLSLTESGSAYYEKCMQILAEVEEAALVATQLTSAPRGTLKVTVPVSFGVMHLAPLLVGYGRRCPDVRLDITVSDRTLDLIEEGFDLAIRISSAVDPSLVARKLGSVPLVICGSPHYLKEHGIPSTPADLAQHACLIYAYASSGGEWDFGGPEGEQRIRVRDVLRVNNGDILRRATLDGMGLARHPLYLVRDDLEAGRMVEVLSAYRPRDIGLYAVYPSRRYLSNKVRTFIDFLAEHFVDDAVRRGVSGRKPVPARRKSP